MIKRKDVFTLTELRSAQGRNRTGSLFHSFSIIRRRAVFPRRLAGVFLIGFVAFLFPSLAAAASLTGTLKNLTTGKPAAGDEVLLLSLRQGMEEAGRTKADARGNFSFKLDKQGPHLIRAIHDGVTYHRIVPPGTTSADVEVYDVSKKVDGIVIFTDIMYLRPVRGQLVVTRAFGVQNSSTPPRTQMNERNLEFYLPDGARVANASAMTENGNPMRSAPVLEGEKNRYAFVFPLRPGLTRFELTYLIPYKDGTSVDPKSIYPVKHFVVVFPKTMQFKAEPSTNFQSIRFPDQRDANVRMASDTPRGRSLAFSIYGEGKLETGEQGSIPTQGASEQSSASEIRTAQTNEGPGGGLGVPSNAPDPLQKHRWWILGGLAAVFFVGGMYISWRRRAAFLHLSRP